MRSGLIYLLWCAFLHYGCIGAEALTDEDRRMNRPVGEDHAWFMLQDGSAIEALPGHHGRFSRPGDTTFKTGDGDSLRIAQGKGGGYWAVGTRLNQGIRTSFRGRITPEEIREIKIATSSGTQVLKSVLIVILVAGFFCALSVLVPGRML